eukprot:CAMPEP_0116025390 /NCGR_PEP_ID=MMETSP0321-20121206/13008_1 /TAXON_ID=163516 /ORGANISM="Leptocylindrus danicus var. danicus, Strain B650" /LENGTH=77 /DNA_ID=CAMNT_0003497551 /DNA_START=76 /DNA_END=306 /DNA_ORIENTATION=+
MACASKDMNQNSVLDICVALDAGADGVVIGAIKPLTLQQDIISVACKDVVIKTRLISGSFTDASAGKSITVSGTIVV